MIDSLNKQELTERIADLEQIIAKNVKRQKAARGASVIPRSSAKTDLNRSRYALKVAHQAMGKFE